MAKRKFVDIIENHCRIRIYANGDSYSLSKSIRTGAYAAKTASKSVDNVYLHDGEDDVRDLINALDNSRNLKAELVEFSERALTELFSDYLDWRAAGTGKFVLKRKWLVLDDLSELVLNTLSSLSSAEGYTRLDDDMYLLFSEHSVRPKHFELSTPREIGIKELFPNCGNAIIVKAFNAAICKLCDLTKVKTNSSNGDSKMSNDINKVASELNNVTGSTIVIESAFGNIRVTDADGSNKNGKAVFTRSETTSPLFASEGLITMAFDNLVNGVADYEDGTSECAALDVLKQPVVSTALLGDRTLYVDVASNNIVKIAKGRTFPECYMGKLNDTLVKLIKSVTKRDSNAEGNSATFVYKGYSLRATLTNGVIVLSNSLDRAVCKFELRGLTAIHKGSTFDKLNALEFISAHYDAIIAASEEYAQGQDRARAECMNAELTMAYPHQVKMLNPRSQMSLTSLCKSLATLQRSNFDLYQMAGATGSGDNLGFLSQQPMQETKDVGKGYSVLTSEGMIRATWTTYGWSYEFDTDRSNFMFNAAFKHTGEWAHGELMSINSKVNTDAGFIKDIVMEAVYVELNRDYDGVERNIAPKLKCDLEQFMAGRPVYCATGGGASRVSWVNGTIVTEPVTARAIDEFGHSTGLAATLYKHYVQCCNEEASESKEAQGENVFGVLVDDEYINYYAQQVAEYIYQGETVISLACAVPLEMQTATYDTIYGLKANGESVAIADVHDEALTETMLDALLANV